MECAQHTGHCAYLAGHTKLTQIPHMHLTEHTIGHSTYFTFQKIEHDPNGTFINPQWREAKNKGKGVIGQKSGIYGAPFEGV